MIKKVKKVKKRLTNRKKAISLVQQENQFFVVQKIALYFYTAKRIALRRKGNLSLCDSLQDSILENKKGKGMFYQVKNNELQECALQEAFSFLRASGHVVSIVGAGGKSTIMEHLADAAAKLGWKTLVMTSTHMRMPGEHLYAADAATVKKFWQEGRPAVIGTPAADGKMTQPSDELRKAVWPLADLILIEADGARMMPCKVPAAYEPVILPETDTVLGVLGLDALDKPLQDVCFRLQETEALLEKSREENLTVEDACKILLSPQGTVKQTTGCHYQIILNKADGQEAIAKGMELEKKLRAHDMKDVYLSCFQEG